MKKLSELDFQRESFKDIALEKYYEDVDISKIISENNLTEIDLFRNLADLEEYYQNKNDYQFIWYNDEIQLIYRPKIINPGLIYLEKSYFHEEKKITKDFLMSNQSFLETFKKISDNKKGFYLSGANGLGKTHFVVGIANLYYEQKGIKTLFVFWPEFIELTKRFKEDNTYYIKKVKNSVRLIIDDLGQESISTWARDDILHSIISYRLEKNLTTIITSNYLLEELKDLYTLKKIEAKKSRSLIEKIKSMSPEYQITGLNKR